MRLGVFLPQMGPVAGPEAISRVARWAEEAGLDGIWVTERTLVPLEPQTPYPAGELPDIYRRSLDPIETLAFVAPQTSRIRLGTSILNLNWYRPVLLARRLATLDLLSNGRLTVGLGQGWSKDEYDVAGTPWTDRGRRFEEALEALKTIWATNPVEFAGDFYEIPASYVELEPVQKPHPPIYMAAYTPAALERTGRLADAWHPVGVPIASVPEMFEVVKAAAERAGRDPASLSLSVRANPSVTEAPLGDDRWDFTGSPDQLASDFARTREAGADELVIDPSADPGVRTADDFLERLELFARLAREAAGAPA